MTDLRPALATLDAHDRETVVRGLAAFGFELDELEDCPPLRLFVSMLATARLAADMPGLTRAEAWEEAGAALGLNGTSLLRRWYSWQGAAARRIITDGEDAA